MTDVDTNAVYAPSGDIVPRLIEGELLIVPLSAGIGDLEDEIYTLNPTGRAIWERLDGQRQLKDVIEELSTQFEAEAGEIERDVVGLVAELVKRRMLVELNTSKPA